jgi:ADP-ribose pyrophosphatase YjhB (NUDIX family)
MLNDLLATIWKGMPKTWRRWSMRFSNARFTVTSGAVIVDQRGRVLLLKHRFRPGSGWGIPGGFIAAGEQPEEAVKRELREEVGLELKSIRVCSVRTLSKAQQVEILFLCRPEGEARPQSAEVKTAEWFSLDGLPQELSPDQESLVRSALIDGAKLLD